MNRQNRKYYYRIHAAPDERVVWFTRHVFNCNTIRRPNADANNERCIISAYFIRFKTYAPIRRFYSNLSPSELYNIDVVFLIFFFKI